MVLRPLWFVLSINYSSLKIVCKRLQLFVSKQFNRTAHQSIIKNLCFYYIISLLFRAQSPLKSYRIISVVKNNM